MTKKIYLKTGKHSAKQITVETEQEEYAITVLNRDTERSIKAQESYNRRFVSFETAYKDEQTFEPTGNLPTPEEEYLDKENREELKKLVFLALGKLTKTQRLIVHKYFWEEKNQAEIAEELGVTKANVSITLTRAMNNLKKLLEKK